MLTITEQILFTIKSSNQRLIYVNTLVRKPTEQKKLYIKNIKVLLNFSCIILL